MNLCSTVACGLLVLWQYFQNLKVPCAQGPREHADHQLAGTGVGGPPVLRARLHSALQDGRGRLVAFLRLPARSSEAETLNASLEKVRG